MVHASVIQKRVEVPFRVYIQPEGGVLDRIERAVMDCFALMVYAVQTVWNFVRCQERSIVVRKPHCSYKSVCITPKKAISSKATPYVIISIDGGGVRGKIPLAVLKRLEKETEAKIVDMTDELIGSSAGGIIVLALTVPKEDAPDQPKFTAAAVDELFNTFSQKVFATSCWHKLSSVFGYREAKYESPRSIIQSLVGETKLSQCISKVAVTSLDLISGNTVLFGNQRQADWNGLKKRQVSTLTIADDVAVDFAATATSAAPTFFPSLGRFVDGGVGANSPALIAALRAMGQEGANRPLFVLSLGTGKLPHEPFDTSQNITSGILPWVGPLIDYLLDASQNQVDTQMELLTEANPNVSYTRFQVTLENEEEAQMDNADPANLQRLEDLANKCFDDFLKTPDGQRLLSIFRSKVIR